MFVPRAELGSVNIGLFATKERYEFSEVDRFVILDAERTDMRALAAILTLGEPARTLLQTPQRSRTCWPREPNTLSDLVGISEARVVGKRDVSGEAGRLASHAIFGFSATASSSEVDECRIYHICAEHH
jgi:hypothetical protein